MVDIWAREDSSILRVHQFHFTLMVCLPFFFITALADEFWKKICVCSASKCQKGNKNCDNLPKLDPGSPTFMEQFNFARKNIKNIELYYFSFRDDHLSLDMRNIAGLTINFTSYGGLFKIDFKYVNDEEYGGCFFKFEKNTYPSFIPIDDNKPTNTFKIGSLDATKSGAMFYMNDGKKTILKFTELKIGTSALANISSLNKLKPGLTYMKIGKKDVLDIIFTKNNPLIKINGADIDFSFTPGDSFNLEGEYGSAFSSYNDTLKITFEDGVTLSDLPYFTFSSISFVEFQGKLWEPSEKTPIGSITKVGNIVIPPGPFPFSVYSNEINLIVSGDTVVHGNIDATYWAFSTANMIISSDTSKRINVSFKGYVDSTIKVHSPYLNVIVDNYTNNETINYHSIFPISFSFNEESASYVYLKSAIFLGSNRRSGYFECYPAMSKSFSDEVLDANNIMKGFYFLEMPNGSIESNSFKLMIEKDAPTVKSGIPGFTLIDNCMNVTLDRTNKYMFKAFKGISAFGTPIYLCLTKSDEKCPFKSGINNPFVYVSSLDEGDISKFVSEGYKEIFISNNIYNKELLIDFNKLIGTGFNITLSGYTGKISKDVSMFKLKQVTKGKINKLLLFDFVLTDSFEFNMPHVQLSHINFNSTKDYSFNATSQVLFDMASLKSVSSIANKPELTELHLSNENSNYNLNSGYTFHENFNINNGIIEICLMGKYQRTSYYFPDIKECVSNLDPKKFKKISYVPTFNLILQSNSMQDNLLPIDIFIRPAKTYSAFELTLNGEGWTTKLKNPINVDHGNYSINVIVTRPGQAENFNITGKGPILYKVNYGSEQKYCIYSDPNETESCYSTQYKIISYNTSEYSTKFNETTNISMSIQLDPYEESYMFPLSFFNKRKVKLFTGTGHTTQSQVEINFDLKRLNNMYSMTIFDNINLIQTKNETVEVSFGQLEIVKKLTVNENWRNNVKLYVSQLSCSYDDLTNFKSVTIDDQLILSGNYPTEGDNLIVDFVQDEEANDLVTNIGGEVTIIVGDNFLQIGKAIFKITHSKNYDANFTVTKKSNITIQCNATSSNEFVKFYINHGSYDTNYTFVGSFPSIKSTEESLIILSGSNRLNITTSSDLPISIRSSYDIEFHLMSSEITTIQGPISYNYKYMYKYDGTHGRIRYYNHQMKKITLKIPFGYYIETIEKNANFSSLMTPNIDLIISKISMKSQYSKSNISLFTTIGNEGASMFTFEDILPENLKFANITYIRSEIKGKIENEAQFPFVRYPEPIIRAQADDLEQIEFSLRYLPENYSGVTHGFSPSVNCLGIKQEYVRENYNEIKLYAALKPSEIPFVIDFVEDGQQTDGELVVDDNNIGYLDDLNKLLPNVFVGIIMRLHRDMEPKKTLNIDNIIAGRTLLSISIESQRLEPFEAYITLPTSKALNLTFTNLKLGFKTDGKAKFLVKSVNFTDCEFLNADEYKISNEVEELHMDVDSLNGLVKDGALSSFNGKMNVNSANVILFTKDGWQFREDRTKSTTLIKASVFKNIQFSTRSFCLLMIEDENLTKISPFKFDAYPAIDGAVYFELSRNWGHIKDLGTFKINVNNASQVNLNTASYPIPKIFDIEDSNISHTLETDIDGNFDVIHLENGKVFRNEDLNIDFQYLPAEYQYINGNVVMFEGETNINFKKNVGVLRVNNSIFTERSNSTLSTLETLQTMEVEKDARVEGIFSFGYASKLIMHWTLNQFPIIVHNNFTGQSPNLLELIYDDKYADRDIYSQLLLNSYGIIIMKGTFECFKMKSNVKFGGNYAHFGENNPYLNVACDASAEGQVLLIQGKQSLPDDSGDHSEDGDSKGGKVSSSGIAGIVIAIAIIVGAVAAGVVYYLQRVKIDRLKNEIPAGKEEAYKTAQYETRDSSIGYSVRTDTESAFDDI